MSFVLSKTIEMKPENETFTNVVLPFQLHTRQCSGGNLCAHNAQRSFRVIFTKRARYPTNLPIRTTDYFSIILYFFIAFSLMFGPFSPISRSASISSFEEDPTTPKSPKSDKLVGICKNCSHSYRVKSTISAEFCTKGKS